MRASSLMGSSGGEQRVWRLVEHLYLYKLALGSTTLENTLLVHHCRQYMIMESMSSSSNWAPNESKRDAWKHLAKGSSYAMREKLAGQKLRCVIKPFSSPSLCPKRHLSLQPMGYSEATNAMLEIRYGQYNSLDVSSYCAEAFAPIRLPLAALTRR